MYADPLSGLMTEIPRIFNPNDNIIHSTGNLGKALINPFIDDDFKFSGNSAVAEKQRRRLALKEQNEPRLAGNAVKPPVPTFDPPALANQPPSPNNPSPAPSTQPPAPAPSTQPPASPNTPNNSATPSSTSPIPLEVIPASESEPQRFSAEAMQETKNDLYDRARAKAVQSGKQEDLDVVRDLGLAMHAKNFPNMGGIRDDLDLNEQRNRAKDFLTASIA